MEGLILILIIVVGVVGHKLRVRLDKIIELLERGK